MILKYTDRNELGGGGGIEMVESKCLQSYKQLADLFVIWFFRVDYSRLEYFGLFLMD